MAIRKNIERAIDNWAQTMWRWRRPWLDGLLNVGLLNNGEADKAASKALMLQNDMKLDSFKATLRAFCD